MKKIWYIAYPFFYYYIVMLAVMMAAQWVFGTDDSTYVVRQLIATLITIPAVLPLYRQGQMMAQKPKEPLGLDKARARMLLFSVGIAACTSVALNNVLSMTPLVELSAGYQEASDAFYGGPFVWQLISLAVFTPILEELVFRGILYGRLLQVLPHVPALLFSAFLFAVVHGNIVQFLYALLLGIVFSLLMDRAGNVYAAIAGHMTANLIAVVRTNTGCLDFSVQGDALSWIFSLGLLALAAGIAGFVKKQDTGKER